jgi:prevent-host-death family protein
MAGKSRRKMIKVPLSEVRDHLSEFVKKAETEEVVVTVYGRPAAVIIGFEDEDDWLEYQLLNDESFQAHVA